MMHFHTVRTQYYSFWYENVETISNTDQMRSLVDNAAALAPGSDKMCILLDNFRSYANNIEGDAVHCEEPVVGLQTDDA